MNLFSTDASKHGCSHMNLVSDDTVVRQRTHAFHGCGRETCSAICRNVLAAMFSLWIVGGLVVSPAEGNQSFVFIDGEFVEPPYSVELLPRGMVSINGHKIEVSPLQKDREDRSSNNPMTLISFQKGPRRRPRPTQAELIDQLQSAEAFKSELVFTLNQPTGSLVIVGKNDQWQFIGGDDGSREVLEALLESPEHRTLTPRPSSKIDVQDALLGEVLAVYQPSDSFRDRAEAVIAKSVEIESRNTTKSQAFLSAGKIGYPLTIVAMVLVALGFGHLLSNKPMLDDSVDPSKSKSIVSRSLGIFVLLSAIDLIWTVLAAQAGSMREMNPIGIGFITNPLQLVAFKFTVVGLSASILYVLRDRGVAQAASWWSCLVLTLLTARWVVFQSMLM